MCTFFCDRVKVELGLVMFFLEERSSRNDCVIADPQLIRTSLLIGNDTVSLLRSDNASYSLIDDDVLSLLMGNNASYFLIGNDALSLFMGNDALSLFMGDNASFFLLSPGDNALRVSS